MARAGDEYDNEEANDEEAKGKTETSSEEKS